MIIKYNNWAELIKNVYGCKKLNIDVNSVRNQKLTPVTDIDDEFVVYEVKCKRDRLVDSTNKKDYFERMSFEKGSDFVDEEHNDTDICFRTEECLNKKEFTPVIHNLQYSDNDVKLAENITKLYSCEERENPPELDTDMDVESKRKLTYINLKNNVVPNSLPHKLNLNFEIIKTFAEVAMDAMDNGITINDVIRALQKCVINEMGDEEASIDLFKFLLKYPNERQLVLNRDNNGVEHLDNGVVRYYPMLLEKTNNSFLAKDILNLCRSKSLDGREFVDGNLCDIALILLKMKENVNKDNNKLGIKSLDKKDIDLISKLKNGNSIDSSLYLLVRKILFRKEIIDEDVINNIDRVIVATGIIDAIAEKAKMMDEKQLSKLKNIMSLDVLDYYTDCALGKTQDSYLKCLNDYVLKQNLNLFELSNNIKMISKIKSAFGSKNIDLITVVNLCSEENRCKEKVINKNLVGLIAYISKRNEISVSELKQLINIIKSSEIKDKNEFYKDIHNIYYWAQSKDHAYITEKIITGLKKSYETKDEIIESENLQNSNHSKLDKDIEYTIKEALNG